jgi:DNA-binding transcriptional regulator of glucitol operon
VHLLKDISKEREVLGGSKLLERFDQAVRDFIDEGVRIQGMQDGQLKDEAIEKLKKQLDRITHMPVTKGRAETLVKRIVKYRQDLIRFVTHPAIQFHNNRAERQLRPMVITRKISFGSNTDRGALRHCVLNTIVQTCKLQDIDPVEFIRRAYVSDGLDVPEIRAHPPPAA